MKFNKEGYPAIKAACETHEEVEFEAPIEFTGFANSAVQPPSDWQAYPPAGLPPEGYAQVFAYAGNDAKGELTRLELLVHLDGGRVLYKSASEESVAIKVTWPGESGA